MLPVPDRRWCLPCRDSPRHQLAAAVCSRQPVQVRAPRVSVSASRSLLPGDGFAAAQVAGEPVPFWMRDGCERMAQFHDCRGSMRADVEQLLQLAADQGGRKGLGKEGIGAQFRDPPWRGRVGVGADHDHWQVAEGG